MLPRNSPIEVEVGDNFIGDQAPYQDHNYLILIIHIFLCIFLYVFKSRKTTHYQRRPFFKSITNYHRLS